MGLYTDKELDASPDLRWVFGILAEMWSKCAADSTRDTIRMPPYVNSHPFMIASGTARGTAVLRRYPHSLVAVLHPYCDD